MTNNYAIWIVSPPDLLWTHVFDEVALSLQSAFKELGYEVPIVSDPREVSATFIALGANLAPMYNVEMPEDCIIFNLEHVTAESRWFQPDYGYIDLLKKYPVFDFNKINIKSLKQFGIDNAIYCGIGYSPVLSCIDRKVEDIDVVFVGDSSPRRQEVFSEIINGGAELHQVRRMFGKERDEWMARGKIHLNIHREPDHLFEIVRVSYLLANGYFIISEESLDKETEDYFKHGIVFCKHGDLAERCLYYLERPEERKRIADQGFELIKKIPQSKFLSSALDEYRQIFGASSRTSEIANKKILPMPPDSPMRNMGSIYTILFIKSADYFDKQLNDRFEDVAQTVQQAFTQLRYDVKVVTDPKEVVGTAVVIGANLAPKYKIELPENSIIFNFENADNDSPWFHSDYGYIDLLKKHYVWDFSGANIHRLQNMGIKNISHCGLGHTTMITKTQSGHDDIEVLFVGDNSHRRQWVFDKLQINGATFRQVSGVFGKERDDWLVRAKIHLSINRELGSSLDILKILHLLANRCFVVAEEGSDIEIEDYLQDGVVFCRHEELADRCLYYLKRPDERRRIAERGYELSKKFPTQIEFLVLALERYRQFISAPQTPKAIGPVYSGELSSLKK